MTCHPHQTTCAPEVGSRQLWPILLAPHGGSTGAHSDCARSIVATHAERAVCHTNGKSATVGREAEGQDGSWVARGVGDFEVIKLNDLCVGFLCVCCIVWVYVCMCVALCGYLCVLQCVCMCVCVAMCGYIRVCCNACMCAVLGV